MPIRYLQSVNDHYRCEWLVAQQACISTIPSSVVTAFQSVCFRLLLIKSFLQCKKDVDESKDRNTTDAEIGQKVRIGLQKGVGGEERDPFHWSSQVSTEICSGQKNKLDLSAWLLDPESC